jgi:hypothetical protein
MARSGAASARCDGAILMLSQSAYIHRPLHPVVWCARDDKVAMENCGLLYYLTCTLILRFALHYSVLL